jgi:hypothetical protein
MKDITKPGHGGISNQSIVEGKEGRHDGEGRNGEEQLGDICQLEGRCDPVQRNVPDVPVPAIANAAKIHADVDANAEHLGGQLSSLERSWTNLSNANVNIVPAEGFDHKHPCVDPQ